MALVRTQRSRLQSASVPAPVGGINTVSPGLTVPPSDSLMSYNLIGGQYGLRSRLGWQEYAIGLTSPTTQIRTLIPFTGSVKSGANDRLFAAETTGIWDVSDGGVYPGNILDSAVYSAGGGSFPADTYYIVVTAVVGATESQVSNEGSAIVAAPNGRILVTFQLVPNATQYNVYWGTASGTYTNYIGILDVVTPSPVLLSGVEGLGSPTGIGPLQVVTFPSSTADSGFGVSTVFVNSAGNHYVAYCDEQHGYHLYSETSGTWEVVLETATVAWVNATVYAAGATVLDGGSSYYTVAGGTSNGTGVADDIGVAWVLYTGVSGVNPRNLAFVVAWKNRLWFIEKDTASGWYLDLGSIKGALTEFSFGARFKAGGDLRCLASWTYDGGAGIDDALVAVSGGGDVLIYQGTDPNIAGAFAMRGVWFVGAVPLGRNLTTDSGGDLLVMGSTGIQSLSKLVAGGGAFTDQYATAKIANIWNQIQSSTRTSRGWSMVVHPEEAALMVLVPKEANDKSQQLVMSLITKGWHQYRDMPMGVCATPWSGKLYFGTNDGRVCVMDGELDAVLLQEPSSYALIEWSMLTGFTNLGRPTQKRIQFIRPTILSQGGGVPHDAVARFRWDLRELTTVLGTATSGGSTWDSALWDAAVWGGSTSAQQGVFGATGIGPEVAIALRGKSANRATIVGIDIGWDEGGFL